MAEKEEDQNPLLNELVIDNISKYLSFQELKTCRSLSHLWKETTNKRFLKQCPFILMHHYSTLPIISSNKEMSIPEFLKIYIDPENPHPQAQLLRRYTKFLVLGLTEKSIPMFYTFMTVVGPQMTSLKLIQDQVLRNSQDLADIVSSKYTPNLEELFLCNLDEIDNYQHNDDQNIGGKENKHLRRLSLFSINNKIQWLDVFSRYPKLKALSLSSISVEIIQDIATGMVAVCKANKTKLKLTELEIKAVSSTGDTEVKTKAGWRKIEELLNTANLPLEKISLDGSTSEIGGALLQHYREILKSVTFKDSIPQPFPLMKALERMAVHQCGDLTFLTQVPNLKSLCFDPYPQHSLQVCFPESPPNPLLSLTEFNGGCWKEWNVTEMEQLLLWMPNVQNLEMRLSNTTFSWICKHLPNLKALTLWGKDLDDSGVVGEFNEGLQVEGGRPNITNLKALESFTMKGISDPRKGLTEKSVLHGFSLMPKLSTLTLCVKSELSADAMLTLTRQIKNLRVVPWGRI